MLTIPVEVQWNGMAVGRRDGAMPDALRMDLENQLRYNHIVFNRGFRAYTVDGERRPTSVIDVRLYEFDALGRLCTKVGFLPRIADTIAKHGFKSEVRDLNPAHPRVDRYKTDWDGVFSEFDLRAKQDLCLCSVAENPFGGTIVAPPGFGKSHLFLMLGRLYPRANMLVVVTRKDVANEIYRGLTSYFPNVGFFGDSKRRMGRVAVSLAQSIQHVPMDDVDILCGDEAHELLTDHYTSRLTLFKNSRNYAFTATPTGRADKSDVRMEMLFGPKIFEMQYQEAQKLNIVVPITVDWVDVVLADNPCAGMVETARERNGIWRNQYRNAIIAEKAMSYGPDAQVLIMVRTLDHACHLKAFLPDFTLAYSEGGSDSRDIDFEYYKRQGLISRDEPDMTADRRRLLKEQFEKGKLKKVIATDVWSTGVNFHQLQVLVRADARGREILDYQIPGRVSRPDKATDKSTGLVVDFRDQFDPDYREAARKRKRNYARRGWTQIEPATTSTLR